MISLNKIKIFGKRLDPIKLSKDTTKRKTALDLLKSWCPSWLTILTQIRKHIPTVIVIPCAGAVEGIEFGGGKGRGGDGQGNGLIKSLLAGKTYTTFPSLICMFVAIAPPTFYTSHPKTDYHSDVVQDTQ